eukprot:7712753-Alexandrium_andersonii.AAC.1
MIRSSSVSGPQEGGTKGRPRAPIPFWGGRSSGDGPSGTGEVAEPGQACLPRLRRARLLSGPHGRAPPPSATAG